MSAGLLIRAAEFIECEAEGLKGEWADRNGEWSPDRRTQYRRKDYDEMIALAKELRDEATK